VYNEEVAPLFYTSEGKTPVLFAESSGAQMKGAEEER